jgi:hypothetical protein
MPSSTLSRLLPILLPALLVACPLGSDKDSSDEDEVSATERICSRWNVDRADLSEGAWSGSVASCDPGDMDASGRENALRVTNLYRWLCDLPPVDHDPVRDAANQACALMMHANGTLSHYPDASWACYSAEGASSAGQSNIATTPAVNAVDLYMVDPGNPNTLGHRRWILSNSLGPIGFGSTSGYSCMHVLYGSGTASASWTAWPPPGVVPFEALTPPTTWGYSLDSTGWSVQSDEIDLSKAEALVSSAGADLPVRTTALDANYGSRWAISFIPQGWQAEAGRSYHIEIQGVTPPITYDVNVVDCSGA